MYPQPHRFLWYLGFIVLFVFILNNPLLVGHAALMGGHLLSDTAVALAKLARSL
jgi:hypothetical protein